MPKEIFELYKKSYEVPINFEDMPQDCLEFLQNFAVAHGSTLSMVLGAPLPLRAALLGPKTGTKLSACHLSPVN